MAKNLYKAFSKFRSFFYEPVLQKTNTIHDAVLDKHIVDLKASVAASMPENIVLRGYKCYSSGEEDGIIEAIFKTISPSTQTFLEIGCGKGLENNSHFLLLKGWKGLWIDGNHDFINFVTNYLGSDRFQDLLIKKSFVTRDNCDALFEEAYSYFNVDAIDFFSLDIDGNDYHIMEQVLESSIFPKVVCVEYNAKWGIHAEIKVAYEPNFEWSGDDYMGVGLGAWVSLFKNYQYSLLCCDLLGNNAFFIKDEYKNLFTIYPVEQLYQPSRYFLARRKSGHPSSLKMLKNVLRGSNNQNG